MTPEERAARALRVEARVGRKLTAAETHMDVEAIDRLLNEAKGELDQAIRAEQQRYARLVARGHTARMNVTERMLRVLRRLRGDGQRHARAELASMGHPVRDWRHHATEDELAGRLRSRLRHLQVKIEHEALSVDLSTIAASAVERAVLRVLGGRSIASDLVAPAFTSGLADTFEQHRDLVDRWQYTAVLDGGTCDPCGSHDGEIYETLDEALAVLPDFGGNPDCLGGERCRCRLLPVPAG